MTPLDETTCPVCGKQFDPYDNTISERTRQHLHVWAVAHYLAHLVQQSCKHTVTEAYAVNDKGGTYHRCVSCHAVTGYVLPETGI